MAILLVASLLVHVNLASLILESVWAVIAVYGLVKAWRNESPSRLREGLGVGKSGVAEAGPPPAPPASGSGDT